MNKGTSPLSPPPQRSVRGTGAPEVPVSPPPPPGKGRRAMKLHSGRLGSLHGGREERGVNGHGRGRPANGPQAARQRADPVSGGRRQRGCHNSATKAWGVCSRPGPCGGEQGAPTGPSAPPPGTRLTCDRALRGTQHPTLPTSLGNTAPALRRRQDTDVHGSGDPRSHSLR